MCVFVSGCLYKSLDIMEITDGNLHVLAGYLQKTLSPDPIERRGGLLLLLELFISMFICFTV